jgi:hypothetical protein
MAGWKESQSKSMKCGEDITQSRYSAEEVNIGTAQEKK